MILAQIYYSGDADEALRLACYLADVQSEPRPDVPFLLVRKQGTPKTREDEVLDYVKPKFPHGFAIETDKTAESYVESANILFFHVMDFVVGHFPGDAVFLYAADCLPLSRDWLRKIETEHALARAAGKAITGVLSGGDHFPLHINGNAVYDVDFLQKHPEGRDLPGIAPWDLYFGLSLAVPNARPTRIMQHGWAPQGYSTQDLLGFVRDGLVWCHGFKDRGGTYARARKLLLKDLSSTDVEHYELMGQRRLHGWSPEWDAMMRARMKRS